MVRTKEMLQEHGKLTDEIYAQQLRAKVETEENIGKLIAIDTNTGDYEIDDDHIKAVDRLRERRPDADVSTKCIGYNAAYAIGTVLRRTAP